MSQEITEYLIARQPPEAQAIIRLLLKKLAELEARLGKSPRNSSLPPSTQHPHAKPMGNISQVHEPGSKRNRRFAAARQVQRQQTVNRDVPRVVQTPFMVVDVRRRERHRADEQHGGARIASGGHLPQTELWHSKRSGKSFRRTDVDGVRDLSSAKPIRIRLSDQSSHRPLLQATTPHAIAQPVNGCNAT